MRSVLRAVAAGALLVSAYGCCAAQRVAMDALVASWDSPDVSIKRYAEAGVACDPLLADDPSLPDIERSDRRAARARRLRLIEEFDLTLKEAQAGAQ